MSTDECEKAERNSKRFIIKRLLAQLAEAEEVINYYANDAYIHSNQAKKAQEYLDKHTTE